MTATHQSIKRDSAVDEVWHITVFWYGLSALQQLRRLTPEARMRVMQEANDWNMREPLWLHPKRDLTVNSWSNRPLTGGEVTALIVFGLWVQIGEREEAAPSLVDDWPELKVASQIIARLPEGSLL